MFGQLRFRSRFVVLIHQSPMDGYTSGPRCYNVKSKVGNFRHNHFVSYVVVSFRGRQKCNRVYMVLREYCVFTAKLPRLRLFSGDWDVAILQDGFFDWSCFGTPMFRWIGCGTIWAEGFILGTFCYTSIYSISVNMNFCNVKLQYYKVSNKFS